MYLHHAQGHADQIRQQAAFFENRRKALNQIYGLGGKASLLVGKEFIKARVCVFVPSPGVHEGLGLGAVFAADVVVNLVVVAFVVEGRVDVAEVNAFVFEVLGLAQDFQIVAVVKRVVHGWVFVESKKRKQCVCRSAVDGTFYAAFMFSCRCRYVVAP